MSENNDKLHPGQQAIMTEIDHLHQQDEQLRRDMGTGFSSINARLDSLAQVMQSHGKTNWNATAVMVTVISVLGALVWFPINHRLMQNETSQNRHAELAGHPGAMILHATHTERFGTHKELIEKLFDAIDDVETLSQERHHDQDAILQREMRILDDRIRQEITDLDKRLQLEMRLLQENSDIKIGHNSSGILEVEKRVNNRLDGIGSKIP